LGDWGKDLSLMVVGVYEIRNLKTGAVYIGSAVDVERRWARHRSDLRCGRHSNRFLQRAWNKYGEASFKFSTIWRGLKPDALLSAEQDQIDYRRIHYPTWLNYNLCPKAYSTLGLKRSQDSVKRQIQTCVQRYGKRFEFVDPGGGHHVTYHLRGFARSNGLEHNTLRKMAAGQLRSHRGWTAPGRDKKRFDFISPAGEIFRGIAPLKAFCVERGLNYKKMNAVHCGTCRSHRGWRKLKEETYGPTLGPSLR
jgi:group I intron endonuclease